MAESLPSSTKRPGETRKYGADFKNLLDAGVTLVSIVSIASTPRGVVAGSTNLIVGAAIINGSVVEFPLSGGTHGEDYDLTVKVNDSAANTVEDGVLIKVRKVGNI